MTIEEMKVRKKELGYTYEQIAELSGVPLGTVQKIFSGVTESPRYDTLKALEQVFKDDESMYIREAKTVYCTKRQGEYTLEDYYALPDEQRVELIDGVMYDMGAPTSIHQILALQLAMALHKFISENKGECMAMVSPIDVQLDCDDKTMVQPDVVVICDRDKILKRCIYGAPDFVIEILSKSTRKKDLITKLNKYAEAGVREYWTVDPDRKVVVVYNFESEDFPVIYGFDAKIPVGIFEEKCEIDFTEIYEYVRFLYE